MKLLNKVYLFLSPIFIFLIHLPFVFAKTNPDNNFPAQKNQHQVSFTKAYSANTTTSVFDSLKLNSLGLSREAYDYAVKGFNYLRSLGKLNNDNIISIVDFSLPSSKKRLFILDLKNYKILFNTYVAHGRNSGKDIANQFSNENESYKSSLGFYVTGDTYMGNHGFSMRLQGEEKGINDNANNRAIVMHSAWYVNENIVKSQGYIGRSQGCPALSEELCKPIIEKIKKGSCLFLYSPDKYYFSHSEILQKIQAV
ncbi:MAG: murein L,D-transpeptidase catalytic domain family protein [Ginsengibacter sp.]